MNIVEAKQRPQVYRSKTTRYCMFCISVNKRVCVKYGWRVGFFDTACCEYKNGTEVRNETH
jgi:hypothetical protein